MHQPEGFVAKGQEHPVCKLNRSIYGLKQSPRWWNSTLDNYLKIPVQVQWSPNHLEK